MSGQLKSVLFAAAVFALALVGPGQAEVGRGAVRVPFLAPLTVVAAAQNPVGSGYRIEADVSMRSIPVNTSFSGARIVMFGSASKLGQPAINAGPMEIVAVVQGGRARMTVSRKSNVWGFWLNTRRIDFEQVPQYYAVISTRPLDAIATAQVLAENGIGFEQIPISTALGEAAGLKPALLQEFRSAAVELGVRKLNYIRQDGGIEFVGTSLFRGQLDLPATIPIGELDVSVFLFRGGQVVARTDSLVQLTREGFESFIYDSAHRHSLLYGLATVFLATCVGVASSLVVGLRRR
jgi:uncharacterized protein (TIGR02186 family)